ncbi:DMT family transporter [Cohnella sp. CFH 77786]|uniref:DMT family transporter n=1 Tax=Cohnella sp. CFH 77786 TaxID=2662265 RepID=UPI001C608EB2|nr:DMT family transporter [Cohnella sp. CFH 77786]
MALLYAFIIGFSFLFTKQALEIADPVDMLAFRFSLSFLAIGIPVWAGWIRLGLRAGHWRRLLPIGLTYPAAFFGFQSFGLAHATSSEGGIFSAMTPVFTLILGSLVLKERTSWIQKLSVLCSVGGVVCIVSMGGASLNGTSAFGIAMLLASAITLALYGVFARSMRHEFNAFQLSFAMMLVGCVCFDAAAIAKHVWEGTFGGMLQPFSHPVFAVSILYIGLLSSLVSSLLSNFVLSKLEAFKMSVFVNLGNLIAVLAGILFLHDKLEIYHLYGGLLILVGVFGVQYRRRDKREAAKEEVAA